MADQLDPQQRAEYDELAEKIRKLVLKKPTHTVTSLAVKLSVNEQLVGEIIDSYLVTGDEVNYIGIGQGGSWIAEDIRQTLVTNPDPEHIGYRWPDGSLHQEPYQEPEGQVFTAL